MCKMLEWQKSRHTRSDLSPKLICDAESKQKRTETWSFQTADSLSLRVPQKGTFSTSFFFQTAAGGATVKRKRQSDDNGDGRMKEIEGVCHWTNNKTNRGRLGKIGRKRKIVPTQNTHNRKKLRKNFFWAGKSRWESARTTVTTTKQGRARKDKGTTTTTTKSTLQLEVPRFRCKQTCSRQVLLPLGGDTSCIRVGGGAACQYAVDDVMFHPRATVHEASLFDVALLLLPLTSTYKTDLGRETRG